MKKKLAVFLLAVAFLAAPLTPARAQTAESVRADLITALQSVIQLLLAQLTDLQSKLVVLGNTPIVASSTDPIAPVIDVIDDIAGTPAATSTATSSVPVEQDLPIANFENPMNDVFNPFNLYVGDEVEIADFNEEENTLGMATGTKGFVRESFVSPEDPLYLQLGIKAVVIDFGGTTKNVNPVDFRFLKKL